MQKQNFDSRQHFSIRKLTIGAASVLIGTSFYIAGGNIAHADTITTSDTVRNVEVQNKQVDSNVDENKIDKAAAANVQNKLAENNKVDVDVNKTIVNNDEAGKQNINTDKSTIDNANETKQKSTVDNANEIKQKSTVDNANETKQKSTIDNANETKQNSTVDNVREIKQKSTVDNANEINGSSKTDKANVSDAKALTNSNKINNANASDGKATDNNGGFDESTWGTLNVSDWDYTTDNKYIQLTDFHGSDHTRIIIPNGADFDKVGLNPKHLSVGFDSSFNSNIMKSLRNDAVTSLAFSKTDNDKVVATSTELGFRSFTHLKHFDGSNLDVSNITNFNSGFADTHLLDVRSLANWDVSNGRRFDRMFYLTYVSDLSPLAKWNISKGIDFNLFVSHGSTYDCTGLLNPFDMQKEVPNFFKNPYFAKNYSTKDITWERNQDENANKLKKDTGKESSITTDNAQLLISNNLISETHNATLTFTSGTIKSGDVYQILIPKIGGLYLSNNDVAHIPAGLGTTDFDESDPEYYKITDKFINSGTTLQTIKLLLNPAASVYKYGANQIIGNYLSVIKNGQQESNKLLVNILSPDYSASVSLDNPGQRVFVNHQTASPAFGTVCLKYPHVFTWGDVRGYPAQYKRVTISTDYDNDFVPEHLYIGKQDAKFTVNNNKIIASIVPTIDDFNDDITISYKLVGHYDIDESQFNYDNIRSNSLHSVHAAIVADNGLEYSNTCNPYYQGVSIVKNKSAVSIGNTLSSNYHHDAMFTDNNYHQDSIHANQTYVIGGQINDNYLNKDIYNHGRMFDTGSITNIYYKDLEHIAVSYNIPDGLNINVIGVNINNWQDVSNAVVAFNDGSSVNLDSTVLKDNSSRYTSDKSIRKVTVVLNKFHTNDSIRFAWGITADFFDKHGFINSTYSDGSKVHDGDLFTISANVNSETLGSSNMNVHYIRVIPHGEHILGIKPTITVSQNSRTAGENNAGSITYQVKAANNTHLELNNPTMYIWIPQNASVNNVSLTDMVTNKKLDAKISTVTIDDQQFIKVKVSTADRLYDDFNINVNFNNIADSQTSIHGTGLLVVSDSLGDSLYHVVQHYNRSLTSNIEPDWSKTWDNLIANERIDVNHTDFAQNGQWSILMSEGMTSATMFSNSITGPALESVLNVNDQNANSFKYYGSIINATANKIENAVQIINLPNDSKGEFSPYLTNDIHLINTVNGSDLSKLATISYSTETIDLDHADQNTAQWLTRSQVKNWKDIKSVKIDFKSNKLPANASARAVLDLKDDNIYDHIGKTIYGSNAIYSYGDNDISLPTLVIKPNSLASAKLTIAGTSQINTVIHYTDASGDHYVTLPDKVKTYTDNQDIMKRSDFMQSDADLTATDRKLLPNDIVIDYAHPIIQNSNDKYSDNYENRSAEFDKPVMYYFNNDTVVFDAKPMISVTHKKAVKRVIHYIYANGEKALDDVIQTAMFVQQGEKNPYTGEIAWLSGDESKELSDVFSKSIVGYFPDIDDVKATIVTPKSEDLDETVKYNNVFTPVNPTDTDPTTDKTFNEMANANRQYTVNIWVLNGNSTDYAKAYSESIDYNFNRSVDINNRTNQIEYGKWKTTITYHPNTIKDAYLSIIKLSNRMNGRLMAELLSNDLADSKLGNQLIWTVQPGYELVNDKSDMSYLAKHDNTTTYTFGGYNQFVSQNELVNPDIAPANKVLNYYVSPLDQSVKFKFVDERTNKQVGDSMSFAGKTGQTIPVQLIVPTDYGLDGVLPTNYTFDAENKDQIILIKHIDKYEIGDSETTDLPTLNVVNYQNQDGNVIKSDSITGKVGDSISIAIPDGYHVVGKIPILSIDEYNPVHIVTVEQDKYEIGDSETTYLPTLNIVNYQTKDGNVIKSNDITGKVGDPINIVIPNGYHIIGTVPTLSIDERNPLHIITVDKDRYETGDSETIDLPTLNVVNYQTQDGNVIKSNDITGNIGDPISIVIPNGYHIIGTVSTLSIDEYNPVHIVTVEKDRYETGDSETTYLPTLNVINYQTQDGNVIKSNNITGKAGDPINIAIPDGYHAVDKIPTLSVDERNPLHIVTVEQDKYEIGDSETTDLPTLNVINYQTQDGNVIKSDSITGKVGDPINIVIPNGYHIIGTVSTLSIDEHNPLHIVTVEQDKYETGDSETIDLPTLNIVNYQTQDGNVIKSDNITGKAGDAINIVIPDGYHAVGKTPILSIDKHNPLHIVTVEQNKHDTGNDEIIDSPVMNIIKYQTQDGIVIKSDNVIGKVGDLIKVAVPNSYHIIDTVPILSIDEHNPAHVIVVEQDKHETGDSETTNLPVINIINYQTNNGTVVKSNMITGKTGDSIMVNVPDGYHIVGTIQTLTITDHDPMHIIIIEKDTSPSIQIDDNESRHDVPTQVHTCETDTPIVQPEKPAAQIIDKSNVPVNNPESFDAPVNNPESPVISTNKVHEKQLEIQKKSSIITENKSGSTGSPRMHERVFPDKISENKTTDGVKVKVKTDKVKVNTKTAKISENIPEKSSKHTIQKPNNIQDKKNDTNQLPQTGTKNSNYVVLSGILIGITGLLKLFGSSFKKNKGK